MAAQSRVEQILKSMLGLAEDIPKPQSRIEELLIDLKQAIEAGGSGDLTEIVGRISNLESNIDEIKMVDDAQNEVIDELDETVVRKTDYASSTVGGIVRVSGTYGVSMGNTTTPLTNGVLVIWKADTALIKEQKNQYRPLVSESIPIFMTDYGIESRGHIPAMQEQINELKSRLDAMET